MPESRTITTIGEALVEFVSHRRNCGLQHIGEFSGPYPSGAPAIFLDQAARMGARTEMIGGVGDDGFGRSLLRRLKNDRVGVGGMHVSKTRSTGVAFVTYYDSGERDFIFHLAGTAADEFEVPASIIDPPKTLLHISASSLGVASMRDKIMRTIRHVSDSGGWITCDPNARLELIQDPSTMSAIHEVIERSDCLLPSTSDLKFLFPALSPEAAIEHLLSLNTKIIALKRGRNGATIVGNGERHDLPAHVVTEVDPTGAGDCFCGTFIALLTQGATLGDAGRAANAAGAIAVTRRGPMEGNSTPAQINDYLQHPVSKGSAP